MDFQSSDVSNPLLFHVENPERGLFLGYNVVNLLSIQILVEAPIFCHPAPYFGRKSTEPPKVRGLRIRLHSMES